MDRCPSIYPLIDLPTGMNLTPKNPEYNKIDVSSKVARLNPNAAEFVPSALQSSYGNAKGADSSRVGSRRTEGKTNLGFSESISCNSDDDEHQYWCHQLPDDITPDFNAMGKDEVPSQGYSSSIYSEDKSLATHAAYTTNFWNKQLISGNHRLTEGVGGMEGQCHLENFSVGLLSNMISDHAVTDNATPVKFLSSQFPGLSAESLTDLYSANGYDSDLTIEMLGQLDLHEDGGVTKDLHSKSLSSPRLQSLSVADAHNELSMYTRDLHQGPYACRSTSSVFRGSNDFIPSARKVPSFAGDSCDHERNSSSNGSIRSNGSRQLLSNSYNSPEKLFYGDRTPSMGASWTDPLWLGIGETSAEISSELREEAHDLRDLARLRDLCLEQASQAFLVDKKTLAKELSEKGQFYNMQMKAARLKADKTNCSKSFSRDLFAYELQAYNRGAQDQDQSRLIDLHDLRVSEALHVLRHELKVIQSISRFSGRRIQATIFLGAEPHVKGTWIPRRLPIAVQQFLSVEGVQYTETQPGLLHVVM